MSRWATLLFVVLTTGGCMDSFVQVLDHGGPSFYEGIAPDLARSCWCCHQPGGTSPDLTTPVQLGRHLDAVVESVADGSMPPLPEEPIATGECGSVRRGAPSPPEDFVARLRAWDGGGRREGDASTVRAPPESCHPRRSTMTLRMELPPRSGIGIELETLCYTLQEPPPPGMAVTGARITDPARGFRSAYLIASANDYGLEDSPCPPLELPISDRNLGALYAAQPEQLYPGRSGIAIPEGQLVSAAIIYDPRFVGGDFGERAPIIELDLVPVADVTRVAWFHNGPSSLSLSPGTMHTVESTPFGGDTAVHSAILTLFDRGVSVRGTLSSPGRSDCLLEHPRFTPGIIRPIHFEPPLDDVMSGRVTCTWDLAGETDTVTVGLPPDGELCLLSLLVDD